MTTTVSHVSCMLQETLPSNQWYLAYVGACRTSRRCRTATATYHHLAEAPSLGPHLLLRLLQPHHPAEPERCNHGHSCRRRNTPLACILLCPAGIPRLLHDLRSAGRTPPTQHSLLCCSGSTGHLLHLLCYSTVPGLGMATPTRHVQQLGQSCACGPAWSLEGCGELDLLSLLLYSRALGIGCDQRAVLVPRK